MAGESGGVVVKWWGRRRRGRKGVETVVERCDK